MSGNNEPVYTLEDLPVGTEIVYLADEKVIGKVVWRGEGRDGDEVEIHWSNGNVSVTWVEELRNRKVTASGESKDRIGSVATG